MRRASLAAAATVLVCLALLAGLALVTSGILFGVRQAAPKASALEKAA